jgi:hypothetical protein
MSSVLTLVASLIVESERILSLAQAEQWDIFSEQEQVRQTHIKQLDLRNVNLSEQKSLEMRNKMQELIALNSQITTICQNKRTEIVSELKKINQGSKAKKAYS